MIAAVLILVLGSLLWLAIAFGVRRDEAYRRAMCEARRAQRLAARRGDYVEELLGTLIATQNRLAATIHFERDIVGASLNTPPWERAED
jgi:hypothetical protein